MRTLRLALILSLGFISLNAFSDTTETSEEVSTTDVSINHHHCSHHPDPECCWEDRHCRWSRYYDECLPKHDHHH